MRFASSEGDPVGALADRFASAVVEGRGDLARGRNLYLLRLLDALWEPDGPLAIPYRPSRNPAAFIAMTFDLLGDHRHSYLASIESSSKSQSAAHEQVRDDVKRRLASPWRAFIEELCVAGLPHLSRVTSETIETALHRPAVSGLPDHLARLPSLLTTAQLAAFDAERFVNGLSVAQVLEFLGLDRQPERGTSGDREQHPTGGDVRAALRRKLDGPWRRAMAEASIDPQATWSGLEDMPLDFLASWPVDIVWLAENASADSRFAVDYALATDAPAPGRVWPAPAPYVTDQERGEFESLTARDQDATITRRATLLRRWGVSALLPSAVTNLDEQLAATAALTPLHAGAAWVDTVRPAADALEVARRHFLQRVAEALTGGEAA